MERAMYRPIVLHPMRVGAVCRQPSTHTRVHLDTPAIDVMTDFQLVSPAMVRPDATLAQAGALMVSRGVRLLFVVNDDDAIIGLVSARDISGERATRAQQSRGGEASQLPVDSVMTLRENAEVMTLADVMHAEVGHILETLKRAARQHAIVVETHAETGAELIRGVFSATHIGRRLGVPVKHFEPDQTFAEIEAALAG